jgi:hypothetical protein
MHPCGLLGPDRARTSIDWAIGMISSIGSPPVTLLADRLLVCGLIEGRRQIAILR